MLAALYARVSSNRQENEKTIRSQIMAIRDKAKAEGYTIIKQYLDDGWPGEHIGRPSLDAIRLDADTAEWDVVIAYDPDRIARKFSYQALISDELELKNKQLLYCSIPPVKTNEDMMLRGMKGLFAEYERLHSAERFRLGKLRKAREGHVVTSQGPYGYEYIPKHMQKQGYYKINEAEAEVVKMIFSWVGEKGFTIRRVMRELKKLDIKPRTSERGVWASSTLTRMLHNQTYVGNAYYNRTQAVRPKKPLIKKKYKKILKSSRIIKTPDKWISIEVPAIIDEALFKRVQKQLAKNSQRSPRNRSKNRYLLGGMIHCPCGCTRQGEGPLNGKHLYYRCTNRIKMYPLERTCFEKGINARVLDKKVWDRLESLLTSKSLIQRQLDRWSQNKNQQIVKDSDSKEGLEHQLNEVKKQEKKYLSAFGNDIIDTEQLKEAMDDLRLKRSVVEKQIAMLTQKEDRSDVIIPSEEVIENYTVGIRNILANADFSLKRNIIEKSIDKVVATQETATVSGCIQIEKEYTNVKFKTISRNCRFAKCGQINII